MAKTNKTTQTSVTNKTFNFNRGENVNLSFTLNIEDTKGMKDFLELLKTATVSVEDEIVNTLSNMNRAMKRLQK